MDNLNTISYEEGWRDAAEPVQYESVSRSTELPEQKPKEKRNVKIPLLLTVQLILSALIVLSMFVVRQSGGEVYNSVKEYYDKEINNEIILKDTFESFTLNPVSDAAED